MKRTIATTVNGAVGYDYEDYLEYCEMNRLTPGEKESVAFYEWVAEEVSINYESDMENIKYFEPYNVPVILTGTLGLYDGRPEITPRRFDSVHDAIERCFSSSISDIEVIWEDGTITVYAYHHDGTNIFEINAENRLPYLYE